MIEIVKSRIFQTLGELEPGDQFSFAEKKGGKILLTDKIGWVFRVNQQMVEGLGARVRSEDGSAETYLNSTIVHRISSPVRPGRTSQNRARPLVQGVRYEY